MSSGRSSSFPRWETGAIGLSAIVFVALRWPLYTDPGVVLGWNSDAAIFGLLARRIAAGEFPWLFPGQTDVGTLTSIFGAAAGTTLPASTGPLALRVGTAIEMLAAIFFFHAALRRFAGPAAASLTTLLLAAGPAFFFRLSYAPLGAEHYFFAGAVLFWYVMRAPVVRLHRWLIFGLLSGLGWWQHRGVVFVIVPALIVIALFDRPLAGRGDFAAGIVVFAAGMAAGLLPVVFGRLAADQRAYVPVHQAWSLAHVYQRVVDTVVHDLWRLFGAETSWILGPVMLALLASAIVHFEPRRETLFAVGVVGTALTFWLLSTEAYRGALRYLMIVVPIAYAFAAREVVRLGERRSGIAAALAAGLMLSLAVPRFREVQEVAAGRGEQHERWPGGFDPRPALEAIARGGYRVCYADFWLAYKLEWLSETGVHFVPYRSVNRTMVESLRLGALPGPKCFVDLRGGVHPLTSEQQTALRLETLWQMHGWPRPTTAVPW